MATKKHRLLKMALKTRGVRTTRAFISGTVITKSFENETGVSKYENSSTFKKILI